MRRLESFGEDINKLEISTKIARSEKARLKGISDEVTIHLNVLPAFMEYRVSRNVYSSLTITLERGMGRGTETRRSQRS